jgi:phage shock protein C
MVRRPSEGWIAGVCAGAARQLGVSALLIRCAVLIGLWFAFTPVLLGYLAAWFLLATEHSEETEYETWRDLRS